MENGERRRTTEPVWMNNNNEEVPCFRDRVSENVGAMIFRGADNWPLRGYKFRPTDTELVVHYLIRKVSGLELPFHKIPDVDLYCFNHPLELAEMYPRPYDYEDWYFFTTRNRKYRNGVRPNRATKGGFWKPTGVDAEVCHHGRVVGHKRALDFYEGKHPGGTRTEWKMHEYRIQQKAALPSNVDGADPMKLDEWVLCKIYTNTRAKKRNNQEDDDAGGGGYDYGNDEYVSFDPPQVRSSQPTCSSGDQVQSVQSNMDLVPINGPRETTPSSSNLETKVPLNHLPTLITQPPSNLLTQNFEGNHTSFEAINGVSSGDQPSSSSALAMSVNNDDYPIPDLPDDEFGFLDDICIDNVGDDLFDFPMCELSQVVVDGSASSSPAIPKQPSDSSSGLP